MFSSAQRLEIMQKFSDRALSLKNSNLQTLANEIGIEVVGSSVYYANIRDWASEDEALSKILSVGLIGRAEAYMQRAEEELEKLEEKMFYLDSDGKKQECRTMVNKARLVIEHCGSRAANLSPDIHGDYIYQIKKCEAGIKDLQKQLSDMAANKC